MYSYFGIMRLILSIMHVYLCLCFIVRLEILSGSLTYAMASTYSTLEFYSLFSFVSFSLEVIIILVLHNFFLSFPSFTIPFWTVEPEAYQTFKVNPYMHTLFSEALNIANFIYFNNWKHYCAFHIHKFKSNRENIECHQKTICLAHVLLARKSLTPNLA